MFVTRKSTPQLKPNNRKRSIKIFIWGVIILFIGSIGWIGYSGILAAKNATAINNEDSPLFFRLGKGTNPEDIKKEGDSRINILLVGADQVAGLSDTIQVLSIDPINNSYSILSIPRDLAVTVSGANRMKINAVYNNGDEICRARRSCVTGVDQGAVALKEVVENVTGQNISYFVRTSFTGLKNIVDTLGGIDIYVDTPIRDTRYPAERGNGYITISIPAGQQRMNGETALRYVRSRYSTSDFDRSRRQQQVISAIRNKAFSVGTFSNPRKVTELINVLGQHIRTDIQVSEIPRFAELAKDVGSNSIVSKSLDTQSPGTPLRALNDQVLGQIIVPKLGANNFSEVHSFVQKVFQEPFIVKEQATITVINSSGDSTQLEEIVQTLKDAGYRVTSSTNSTATQRNTTVSENRDKPFTVSLLKRRLNAETVRNKNSTTDIEIIIGTDFKK